MCVTLAFIVMAAASTLVMRSWMLGDMDSEPYRLTQRAGEHLDVDDVPDPKVERGDADASADDDDDTRTMSQSGGRGPRPGGSVIPGGPTGSGFGGFGISEGMLQYVSEDGEAAGAAISNLSVKYLDERALATLADVPTDGAPHAVRLKGLGTSRVTSQVVDGKTVPVGVQMDSVGDAIFMPTAVEVGLFLVVAAVADSAGRAWVRRELYPLGVVRAAAADIVSRDLVDNAGELIRVGEEATSGPVEVADVVGVLSSMIDAVEDGMERRARSEVKLHQLAADVSHELRTPLAFVRGYTQLAHRDIDDTSRAQALECILSKGARMASLMEEMLILTRLDEDCVPKQENADVTPLILNALSDVHVVAPDHAWAFGEVADVQVLGGEAVLRQILTNLLANACVYTPADTRVTVSLARVPQGAEPAKGAPVSSMVTLRITDDGPDILAEICDRVFDHFVYGDSLWMRDGRGSSGPGMSIVESLARAMGGAVRLVDSEKGTIIDMILPAA